MALLALGTLSIVAMICFIITGRTLNKLAVTAFWATFAAWSFGVRL